MPHEEGIRATLIGPEQVGTGEVLAGITAPTFSALLCAPVLELADRRDLHSRDQFGRSGPNPDWGTTKSPQDGTQGDNSLE